MKPERELALFVFIDALGWEVYSKQEFLFDQWATAKPLETVLGYSCTCDPTILTGCMPEQHGHFSFFLADSHSQSQSPFRNLAWMRFLPSRVVDRGRVRRWLSRYLARRLDYDGYFQIYETPFEVLPYFDYSEKKDIYQPGGILGGQPTIFDVLRSSNIQFSLSDWRQSEKQNFDRLHGDVQAGDISFAYLYLAGLDGIMHAEGTQSARVAQHLRWYESELGKILETANQQFSHVRLYAFSDHGMTNVTDHLDLISDVNRLPLVYGKDYLAYYDSTMARFWFLCPDAEQQICDMLGNIQGGHVLTNQELHDFGVYFPDHRYGECIFLCDPGVLICPSFMGKRPLAGMHGYDPADTNSKAFFGASHCAGPMPQRLDQLFDLMRWEVDRLSETSNPVPPNHFNHRKNPEAAASKAAASKASASKAATSKAAASEASGTRGPLGSRS